MSTGHEWWGLSQDDGAAYRCLVAKSYPLLAAPWLQPAQAPSVHGSFPGGNPQVGIHFLLQIFST